MQYTQTNTREIWLVVAIDHLKPIFQRHGYILPAGIQVSCGFPSSGTKASHIGECWSTKSSCSQHNQIFISPVLTQGVDVLDTLVHELVHAVDDCQSKHGKPFKKIATKIGLVGHMRSACAGPQLRQELSAIAQSLGKYPHTGLKIIHQKRESRPRPRAKCQACGFQVPMFTKFLDYGPPICPKDKICMTQVGEWER